MKQPRWKTWLSYFTEIVLEQDASNLNPDLQLGLKKGRYCLSTPNAIYSFADLYGNFTQSFHYIKIKEKNIQDALILGFGLGSIPYMLEKVFGLECRYTGVEADELIAFWASKYVLDEVDSPVQMITTDASIFVDMCDEKFDLIAMDIFIDNEIPAEFEEVGFLEKLKNLLNDEGILMYNRLFLRDLDKKRTKQFFENEFKSVFPKAQRLAVDNNWMLFNR